MPGVYASLDVLVLPSFDEAMPMCLLEGLATAASRDRHRGGRSAGIDSVRQDRSAVERR